MAGLKQINRMRESIVEEIVRGFSPRHQAEAFGLLAQALLMEARHRSSTEYAAGLADSYAQDHRRRPRWSRACDGRAGDVAGKEKLAAT